MIKASTGDTVTVQYVGRLADGTVFDQSTEERPLLFILGKGEVIAGFDAAVTGMYQGETRTVQIPPDEAYGPHEPQWVERVERTLFPDDLQLEVGRQLEVQREDGQSFRLLVTDLDAETVTVDGNHPLAGKELTFEITLVDVVKPPVTH